MYVNFRMIIFWTTVVLCISHSTAWWWGSSEPNPQDLPHFLPPVYYQQRLLKTHSPVPYAMGAPGPGEPQQPMSGVPAIPVQVPLQAQLAPAPNLHTVQLVPCLCPISNEDFEKEQQQVYNNNKEKV